MRYLLLHPENDPLAARWASNQWDRVIDLGIAGSSTYKGWREALGSEIEPCPMLETTGFQKLREMHGFGIGQVVDEYGLDWWNLACLRWLDPFVQLVQIAKLVASMDSSDEIWLTSASHARLLDVLSPGQVRQLNISRKLRRAGLARLRKLKFNQVLEILGDKYDGGYRWRRWIAPSRADCSESVVLLPSAYGNASRTALTLAASLPDEQFLLVATRRSAWVQPLPQNTKGAWLSSYAGQPDQGEVEGLLDQWERLRHAMNDHRELALLSRLGCFDTAPAFLREGLSIRNAWANVLEGEPAVSVLCPDEKNPYTRIPVLLAQRRGLATVACHHGALDGRYLFSDVGADQFLAKSEMEWDYMVRVCGMPQETVRLGSRPHHKSQPLSARKAGNAIVFFSEPYESWSGRAHEIYAEVLPGLAKIAREHGRKVVVKLHPFESLRDREQLAARVLTAEDHGIVNIVTGPLTNKLMQNAWCSVTVSSSAAVDCAAQGIPAFLCLWLDRYGFGYGEQFVKFRAATALRAAEEIQEIPKLLEGYQGGEAENFSPSVQPELLRDLLFPSAVPDAPNQEAQAERLWA